MSSHELVQSISVVLLMQLPFGNLTSKLKVALKASNGTYAGLTHIHLGGAETVLPRDANNRVHNKWICQLWAAPVR